ncbi:unnamed protein product, partial [marine sediment metagenome]
MVAEYIWLGDAVDVRTTICDYPYGSTKPKFKTAFERDGLLRVTKVDNNLTEYEQAGNGGDLGTWEYTYDSSSNVISAMQTGSMAHLDADRVHTYDTLNRLLTTQYWDAQDWSTASEQVSWYSYDDMGNCTTTATPPAGRPSRTTRSAGGSSGAPVFITSANTFVRDLF